MAKEDVTLMKLRVPMEVYLKIRSEAKKQMRTAHSLAVYALAKFAEKIGTGK